MYPRTVRHLLIVATLLPCLVVISAGETHGEDNSPSVLTCPSEIPESLRNFPTFIAESNVLLIALEEQGLDGLQRAIRKSSIFRNDNHSLTLKYHVGQLTSLQLLPGTSQQDMAFFVHFDGHGEPRVIAQRNLFWTGEHMVVLRNGSPRTFRTVERDATDDVTAFYRKGRQITWDESGKLADVSVLTTREPLLGFRVGSDSTYDASERP